MLTYLQEYLMYVMVVVVDGLNLDLTITIVDVRMQV